MCPKELPYLTKISRASSDSIRTIIPKIIADKFELNLRDDLIWKVDNKILTIKKWDDV